MNTDDKNIHWFREASPYIDAHRGKTFVIYVGGEAIEDENFQNIISDLSLLASLGIRLIVVHGAEPQINQGLKAPSNYSSDIRITTPDEMGKVLEIVGGLNTEIQAKLSSSMATSALSKKLPNRTSQVVVSGNFLKAKPLGVKGGVDFQQTGEVRRFNSEAMTGYLEYGAIVLVSPIGYSPSGEIFNLSGQDLAFHVAAAMKADKLVFYVEGQGVLDREGKTLNELQPGTIHDIDFSVESGNHEIHKIVNMAGEVCLAGVNRCHLISYKDDGALLKELFTRDGIGTQISRHSYEQLRSAEVEDLAGIIALITPLEEKGVLVKRSRELLESELDNFIVIERDGLVIACGALYQYERYQVESQDSKMGELACLAIHQDYRNDGKGDLLLEAIEGKARSSGIQQLFVLTTQSAHWFSERGFEHKSLDNLPKGKMDLYNETRNSKLLVKMLADSA